MGGVIVPPRRPARALTRRRFLALASLGVAGGALASLGCGGSSDPASAGDVEVELVTVTPTTPPSGVAPTPTAEAFPRVALDPTELRGFAIPVADGCLPDSDNLMPNAPRTYRNGVHEGIDWYNGLACAVVGYGTAVHAMYEGTVIRLDRNYAELTSTEVSTLARRTASMGYTDAETLDIYRGRQVWLDHGNGVVTRYCHLSSIAPALEVGARVERGQTIGGVGESGTPESVTDPGTEMHLHAEVRVGDSFLGAGLPPATVRRLYARLYDLV
jgi:murein DD-endopeptidase MepM/ murein hydrolase activator NlpD